MTGQDSIVTFKSTDLTWGQTATCTTIIWSHLCFVMTIILHFLAKTCPKLQNFLQR